MTPNRGLLLNAALSASPQDVLLLPLGSSSLRVSILACSLVLAVFDPNKILL